MKKIAYCMTLIAMLVFVGCSTKSPYEKESSTFPTEIESDADLSSAIPMAWLMIGITTDIGMDFSYKHISAERIGNDAYKIAGRCFYSDSEHLYQIRIHFKGDERFNLKDWEYSVIDISNLDRTETEYHSIGSWDGDYN
ncbi:MAG: hypothetical protein J5965_26830 [Aeriscardovia sp.]|nr:hypothetical protein [Aeriscardovia sp.]MBO6252047.1 hypothetical protein [Bacteroidaceae bacterium]